MPRLRQFLAFVFILVLTTLFTNDSFAQTKERTAKEKKFASQFWTYLLSNNYKHWSPPSGKTTDHFASQVNRGANTRSPHGATLKMYVNRVAASNPNSLPIGSVLVVENYRSDKSLESISVMYRTEGFNPSANDWYWANYNPDGTVASEKYLDHANGITMVSSAMDQTYTSARAPKKLMGRVQSCIQCHQSGGNDLAFFNNNQLNQPRVTTNTNSFKTSFNSVPTNNNSVTTSFNPVPTNNINPLKTTTPTLNTSVILNNQLGNTTLNQAQTNNFSRR